MALIQLHARRSPQSCISNNKQEEHHKVFTCFVNLTLFVDLHLEGSDDAHITHASKNTQNVIHSYNYVVSEPVQ